MLIGGKSLSFCTFCVFYLWYCLMDWFYRGCI